MLRGIVAGIILLLFTGDAHALTRTSTDLRSSVPTWTGWGHQVVQAPHHHRKAVHVRRKHIHVGNPAGLVTVPTAAGISITVAQKLAPQFQGFVADLVQMGYTPKHIGCYASGGHVANSNHYHGGACDFDQTGWGRTAAPMYHISGIATKWGLRDGCSFRHADCGHVDDGTNIKWKHPNSLLARYIDHQISPVQKQSLEPFQE